MVKYFYELQQGILQGLSMVEFNPSLTKPQSDARLYGVYKGIEYVRTGTLCVLTSSLGYKYLDNIGSGFGKVRSFQWLNYTYMDG